MLNLLFVSVNQSFREDMDLAQLEACAAGNWDITVSQASTCDRVVAVFNNGDGPEPVGAWRLRGAYASDEAPMPGHHRTALSLGEPLPVLAAYRTPPSLRRGVGIARHYQKDPS
jgi:hypothetical protein